MSGATAARLEVEDMANKRQLRIKVLDLLKRKPRIYQPGRLIAHLKLELGHSSNRRNNSFQPNETQLTAVLEQLAKDGLIILTKAGSVYIAVETAKSSQR